MNTARLQIPVPTLAGIHGAMLTIFVITLIALGVALGVSGADRTVWRRYSLLVAVVVAQAAVGITQYQLGVPIVLVALHVLGSMLTVAAMASLWTATRDCGPLPAAAGIETSWEDAPTPAKR